MKAWIIRKVYRERSSGFQRHVVALLMTLTMMGPAGPAFAFGGYGIPNRPSAKTLSRLLKPDLAVGICV